MSLFRSIRTRSDELTREGMVVGTAAYMSPEQAQGMSLDRRSDVFSFGIMLYEMVAGTRPFRGETATTTRLKIIEAEPEPLPESVADLPPEMERIIRRCLKKKPDDRYNDTRDLVVALKDLRQETSSGRQRRVASGTGEQAVAGGFRWRSSLFWGAAGLVVGLATVLLFRGSPAPAPG